MTEQRPTLYSAVDPETGVRFWKWLGKPGRVEMHGGRYVLIYPGGHDRAVVYPTRSAATESLWLLVRPGKN